jgi:hypothetical protein
LLKEYQDELDREKQGVAERIKQLETSWLFSQTFFLFF